MKTNALSSSLREWDANPRLYDRLNTVCMILLGLGLLAAVMLVFREAPGPKPGTGSDAFVAKGLESALAQSAPGDGSDTATH